MGDVLVKAARDQDIYLIWSTIVDAPTWIFGSRDEASQHLWREYRWTHPDCTPGQRSGPAARLKRADDTGTSAIEPAGMYGWDDDEFVFMEGSPQSPEGSWWVLPRTKLADYCRRMLDDDEPGALALLELRSEEPLTLTPKDGRAR